MQPMQFCILSGRQFEDTFENTQWRKVKTNVTSASVHPMQFEEAFEKIQRERDLMYFNQISEFSKLAGSDGS